MAACADPGIFARGGGGEYMPDCQTTALTPFFFNFFFSPQLINVFYSFTVVYQSFISKKTVIFQGFRGGPIFSKRVHPFPGGGATFSRGVSKC